MEIRATITETRKVNVTLTDLEETILNNLPSNTILYIYKRQRYREFRHKFDISKYWYRRDDGWYEDYDHGHYEGRTHKRNLTEDEKVAWDKIEKIVID